MYQPEIIMNQSIEHIEAAQAAEYAADLSVQTAVWAGLQWWDLSDSMQLNNIVPSGDRHGTKKMTTVCEIWK
jgi:hypothetical protein